MNKKKYPKTVVLRKSLIGVAIFAVTIIVIVICYNIYYSSDNQNRNQQQNTDQQVPITASNADTNWYQNQAIHKAAVTTVSAQIPTQQAQPLTAEQPAAIGQQPPDQQNQQQQQDYEKAMSAPINSNQISSDQSTGANSVSNTSPVTSGNNAAGATDDQNMQGEKKAFVQMNNQATDDDYLGSAIKNPISAYEIQAGTIIPGILITGINSDLPGQITGQVRSNVYDTISGKYLLIPQGARLTGLYDSQVAYGQERVLVVWKRIIFPNGQSLDLQGMPGVDLSGYAGFNDQVNNHYGKIFGSVLLLSVLGAGAQLSQPQQTQNPFAAPTVGQTLAQSLGTNLSNTGSAITAKNINIQPTLQIRPGYFFNISVTKDMVFSGAYSPITVIGNANS